MKASSASGLCARWMVRVLSAATPGVPGGGADRLLVEGVEVGLVLGVLGSLAGALRRFVPEEIIVGLSRPGGVDRKSTRLNSSHANISYAVFCLKKKKNRK